MSVRGVSSIMLAVAVLAVAVLGGSPAEAADPPTGAAQPSEPASVPGKATPPDKAPASAPAVQKLDEAGAAGGGLEAVVDPGKGQGGKDVAMAGTLKRPRRALVGIEVAGGVAIPLKNYLDFGSGQDSYFMENGVGGGIAVSLTLDNVELRWTYTALSAGRVSGRIPDEAIDGLRLIDQQLGGDGNINQEIDVEAEQALAIHNITFGYRLTFEPTDKLRIVVPFGAGIVIAQPPDFGLLTYSLYGFGGHVGLRGEYLIAGMVAVGLDTRLMVCVTEPDPNLGAAGYAATRNVFDAAIAWLPMINVALHARFYY